MSYQTKQKIKNCVYAGSGCIFAIIAGIGIVTCANLESDTKNRSDATRIASSTYLTTTATTDIGITTSALESTTSVSTTTCKNTSRTSTDTSTTETTETTTTEFIQSESTTTETTEHTTSCSTSPAYTKTMQQETTTEPIYENSKNYTGRYYCGGCGTYGYYGRTLVSGYSVATWNYPDGTLLYITSDDGYVPTGTYRVDDTGCSSDTIDFYYSNGCVPSSFRIAGVSSIHVTVIG